MLWRANYLVVSSIMRLTQCIKKWRVIQNLENQSCLIRLQYNNRWSKKINCWEDSRPPSKKKSSKTLWTRCKKHFLLKRLFINNNRYYWAFRNLQTTSKYRATICCKVLIQRHLKLNFHMSFVRSASSFLTVTREGLISLRKIILTRHFSRTKNRNIKM